MTLRRVNRGDRMLTAVEQNRITDGAELALRNESAQPTRGYVRNQTSGLISIINQSGANRPQGSVLEIVDLLPDEISRQDLLFDAGLPSGANVPWCVTRDAVAEHDSVAAYTSGTFLCRVNVQDLADEFAAVEEDSDVAQSGGSGPIEILWHPGSTGEHLCLVRSAGGAGGRKIIDFELAGTLTTDDESTGGTIIAEYGPGGAAPDSAVTLINPMGKAFFGSIGDRGLALHHEDDEYVIIQLVQDCTP